MERRKYEQDGRLTDGLLEPEGVLVTQCLSYSLVFEVLSTRVNDAKLPVERY